MLFGIGVAEGVGFEPTIRLPVYTLSKRAPSATRPSLRVPQARPNIDAGDSERKLASRQASRWPSRRTQARRPLRRRNARAMWRQSATGGRRAPRQPRAHHAGFLSLPGGAVPADRGDRRGLRRHALDGRRPAGDDLAPASTGRRWRRPCSIRAERRCKRITHPLVWDTGLRPAAAAAGMRSCSSRSALLFAYVGRRRRRVNVFAN